MVYWVPWHTASAWFETEVRCKRRTRPGVSARHGRVGSESTVAAKYQTVAVRALAMANGSTNSPWLYRKGPTCLYTKVPMPPPMTAPMSSFT
eukprot:5574724-Pyramimonas_sp.AAC.2